MLIHKQSVHTWLVVTIMLLLLTLTACNDDSPAVSEKDELDSTSFPSQGNLQETIRYADGSWEMEYSVFTCYPGAVITVLNADMDDPEYAEDQKPHPQRAIDTASGTPINIVDEMEPIAVTPDYLGLYNKESSVYVLRFEVCVE